MIFKVLKNPVFKIVGVGFVLYYALFSERKNPNALSQRFSSENIEKSKEVAAQKVKFIAYNIKASPDLKAAQQQQQDLMKDPQAIAKLEEQLRQQIKEVKTEDEKITINDTQMGDSAKKAACGSEVKLVYVIFDQMMRRIDTSPLLTKVLDGNKDDLIMHSVIGMNESGIREIVLWPGASTTDKKINTILKKYNSKIRIQISLVSILGKDDKIKCQ